MTRVGRILFWDFEGTLAKREGQWSGALRSIARNHHAGRPISLEAIRPHMQRGFPWHSPDVLHEDLQTADEWWDRLVPLFTAAFCDLGFRADQATRMARQVRGEYLDPGRFTLADGVIDVLRRLSSDGWKHVMVSNHVPELGAICERLGLAGYFQHIFTSATLGVEKPNRLFLRKVLGIVGRVDHGWMIGDSVKADVAAGSAAGLNTILVGSESREATYCVSNLRPIPELLRHQT